MKFGITRLNKNEAMKKIIVLTLCAFTSLSVFATLPPLSDEAQAAADLAKAKGAYGDKIAAYQLCQAQNRVADRYKAPGAPVPAACVAPPPFVAPGAMPAVTPAAK